MSWYLYHGGSLPAHWGLALGMPSPQSRCRRRCGAIRGASHQGGGVLFLLEGARDLRQAQGGGFVPETLRSEYHEIRATLEAYAQRATIAGRDEAEGCGLALHKGRSASA